MNNAMNQSDPRTSWVIGAPRIGMLRPAYAAVCDLATNMVGEWLSPRARIVAGVAPSNRLAHDDEARSLEMLDQALGHDLRHGLGGLVARQRRFGCEAERKGDHDLAWIGGREIAIVGHGQNGSGRLRTKQERH